MASRKKTADPAPSIPVVRCTIKRNRLTYKRGQTIYLTAEDHAVYLRRGMVSEEIDRAEFPALPEPTPEPEPAPEPASEDDADAPEGD